MTQSFDPLAFLNLAKELADQSGDEAKLRTAINRAYYAVFLVAREKTFPGKIKLQHGDVKKRVIQKNRAIADKLSTLYRYRHAADYQLIPKDPSIQNWERTWLTVHDIVYDILPRLQAW